MNVVVFGVGLVGSAIVKDLASDQELQILGVDRDQDALVQVSDHDRVATRIADLSDQRAILNLIKEADLVISAVPGFMGFETLKGIIMAGKNVVDISFFPEDPFLLDSLAKEKGVTAVVDAGVAPGLCNILAGNTYENWDQVDSYSCYVGGLPQIREWPYEYKAVFSPADVLEEYTRPARFIENGEEVVYPALSGLELIDFNGVGTLEAFNTDGLRTLRHTLSIPDMREKTLRYPGHAQLMKIFRESGFFNQEEILVHGQRVQPLALTSQLLFERWKLKPGERDLTVMQVRMQGTLNSELVGIQYDLLDAYDDQTGVTSMARTTGYTCTGLARLLIKGMITDKGIIPPEEIGKNSNCFEMLRDHLETRNIQISERKL